MIHVVCLTPGKQFSYKISIDNITKLTNSDPSSCKNIANTNDNQIKRSCTSDLESSSKNTNNGKKFEKTIHKLLNPFNKKESYKTISNINSSSSGSLKLLHKSSSVMKYHSKNTTENFFAVKEVNENYGVDSDSSTNLDESIDIIELDGKLLILF